MKYCHRHCIHQTAAAFRLYASDHKGNLPFSTNGFGDALMLLVNSEYVTGVALTTIPFVCGPDDDGHVFAAALTNHSIVPEAACSRVYVQGLNETNNPEICVLFDRNSCNGGDHARSPWAHRLREVCLLDSSVRDIRDEAWPEFSRKQVELLVAAGFSRTNALHYYPAAN